MTEESVQNNRCRHMQVVGVGNAGCSIIARLAKEWKDGPQYVAINTDLRDFIESEQIKCIQIGTFMLKGMGTGGDPRMGCRAIEADIEDIRDLFKDVDMVFLVVGLGGGTGTGAAPVIAEEAGKAGAITLCVAALPFDFEGKRRMENAERGFNALRDTADGVFCVPNQRLIDVAETTANINKAFDKTAEVLCRSIKGLWRVLTCKGAVNIDFACFRTLIQKGNGRCVLSSFSGTGKNKVKKVLNEIGRDYMLEKGKVLAEADSYIVSIIGGNDLSLRETDEIMTGVKKIGSGNALVMTGIACDPSLQDKVEVVILVLEMVEPSVGTGLNPEQESEENKSVATHHGKHAQKLQTEQKKKLTQASLFDSPEHGRFKGVDPTIVGGNNLDIPTFIRRGVLIQKMRNNNS